jgi:hypothetical protein
LWVVATYPEDAIAIAIDVGALSVLDVGRSGHLE